ncbi:NUDIX hydrolase [Flindersiella endophytica]
METGVVQVQRKVTSFVTRGAELCVFWHTGSGIQVPAGTVEEGEDFETAARREATEETGLPGLELVGRLGARTYDAPPDRAWMLRVVKLRTTPGPDAPVTAWSIPRASVRLVDIRDGSARVVYEESDIDADPQDRLTYARFEGWVPQSALATRQRREFYHFRTTGQAPDEWRQQAEPEHEFHLRWLPLAPKPTTLVPPQQLWLDEFHQLLLDSATSPPPTR